MVRKRTDNLTQDLFDWKPKIPVERYEDHVTRAATLQGRISLAVSKTLNDATDAEGRKLARDDVAKRMAAYLGEKVSKTTLDAYASEARENSIPLDRAVALMIVTQDFRLLSLLADPVDHAVIPAKYQGAVVEAMLVEKREEIDAMINDSRRARK